MLLSTIRHAAGLPQAQVAAPTVRRPRVQTLSGKLQSCIKYQIQEPAIKYSSCCFCWLGAIFNLDGPSRTTPQQILSPSPTINISNPGGRQVDLATNHWHLQSSPPIHGKPLRLWMTSCVRLHLARLSGMLCLQSWQTLCSKACCQMLQPGIEGVGTWEARNTLRHAPAHTTLFMTQRYAVRLHTSSLAT